MSKFLRKLNDPELDNKDKLSSKDNFELVYLRHRYFRMSTNPSPARMAQFEEMTVNMSNKIFYKNIGVFKSVGMDIDDLKNIGRVHVVSFISMSGLHENPKLMEKFLKAHKKIYGNDSIPSKKDIFLRESYNLASFLRQRMSEMVSFCHKKSTNIRGTKSIKRYYKGDPNRSPTDYDLYSTPDVFNYKQITGVEYKRLVKLHKKNNNFIDNGKMVRAVFIEGSYLTQEDISDSDLDPRRSSFYRNPEDSMIVAEGYLSGEISKYDDKYEDMWDYTRESK